MTILKWTNYLGGTQTGERELGPLHLYAQHDKGRPPHFMRASFIIRRNGAHWPKSPFWINLMLGVHLGRLNYATGWGRGFEIFGHGWHVGLLTSRNMWNRSRVKWSGSQVEPYSSVTVRVLWRLFIGIRSPKWLIAMKERQVTRHWEQMPDPPRDYAYAYEYDHGDNESYEEEYYGDWDLAETLHKDSKL